MNAGPEDLLGCSSFTNLPQFLEDSLRETNVKATVVPNLPQATGFSGAFELLVSCEGIPKAPENRSFRTVQPHDF
jgi:hypothetical protein